MRRARTDLAAAAILATAGTVTACGETAAPCVGATLDAAAVARLQDRGHAVTYSGRGVWAIDGDPVAVVPAEDVDAPVCLSWRLARELAP
jgi:hypothetical protein